MNFVFLRIKNYWHEANAFLSAFTIMLTGNLSERKALKGRLFSRKFMANEYFVKKLRKKNIQISNYKEFKKVKLDDNTYYWPSAGSLESLFVVLAESFFKDHPHYYDSEPTVIRKGDKVLDIGASEGAFSFAAAQKGAFVTAVEPSKTMIKAMELSVNEESLKNITFECCVLGASNSKVGFKENITYPEASMVCELNNAPDFRQCWTLNSFIEIFFPDGIDYIKCDAEGADFEILNSGREALMKYKPKIAVASYHSQFDFRKIQHFLESIGYTVVGQGLNYSPVLHKCYPTLLKAF